MKLVKLKSFDQATFLGEFQDGVCYYMCNFIEQDIWHISANFNDARQKAKDFNRGTAMMNYAKSQNVQRYAQTDYRSQDSPTFEPNSLY